MSMSEIKKRVELYEDNAQTLDNIIKWTTTILERAERLKQYNELEGANHSRLNELLRGELSQNIEVENMSDALWLVQCKMKHDTHDTALDLEKGGDNESEKMA